PVVLWGGGTGLVGRRVGLGLGLRPGPGGFHEIGLGVGHGTTSHRRARGPSLRWAAGRQRETRTRSLNAGGTLARTRPHTSLSGRFLFPARAARASPPEIPAARAEASLTREQTPLA